MKHNSMKKKLTSLFFCLVLVLSLAACGSKDDGSKLTKWYDSKDRTQLEDQINAIYGSQGLKFFVTVEEPDTIVYNYQYEADPSLSAADYKSMAAILEPFLDSAGAEMKSDIKQFQNLYKLPVKTIRMAYLDPDGNMIVSKDIDENFESSGNSGYSSLDDWLLKGKDEFVASINPSLESSGLTVDFGADGDILVLIYQFTQQVDLPDDYSAEELQEYFVDNMAASLGESAASMQDGLEVLLGFDIPDIRIQAKNADGTLLGEVLLSDIAN